MKNSKHLKKYILVSFILSLLCSFIFACLSFYQYFQYTNNTNQMLSAIVETIADKYPDITNQEISAILNASHGDASTLLQYGINIEKNNVIIENEIQFKRNLIINSLFFLLCLGLLILYFIKYNINKEREIQDITYYLEQLNLRNYSLALDSLSEDELSILKTEIYKVTVLLKESAELAIHDKLSIKQSLEDISHQLKTPLTSMLINIDNILDYPEMDEEMKREFLHDIKDKTNQISFLVQSLLKLSKFDANTIAFIPESINLQHIISRAIDNVSPLCDLKNIEIHVEGDQPILKLDQHWQCEAITNILKNCIDYTPNSKSIYIDIKDYNVYSQITIKDEGVGISAEDLPHIFERFYKGKNASKDSVGIGLALAKTIIQEENGTIDVLSNTSGTTFIIKYYKV